MQKEQFNLNTTENSKSVNPQVNQKIKDLQEKVGGVSKYRQKINEKINSISGVKTESETKTDNEKQLTFRKIINQRVDEVKKNSNINHTSEKQVNKMERNNSNNSNNLQLNEDQLIKRKDTPVGEPRPMSYAERIFARAEAFEKAKINNKNLVLSGEVLNRINSLPTDENPNLNNIVNNLTNNNNDLNNDFTNNNNLNNEQYMQNNMQNNSISTNQQLPIEQNIQAITNNLPNLNNFVQLPQNPNLLQQQMQQQLLNFQNQQILTNPLLMQLYPQLVAQQQLQQQMQQQLLLNQMLNFNPMLNNLYL